jgi:hypothetical protein
MPNTTPTAGFILALDLDKDKNAACARASPRPRLADTPCATPRPRTSRRGAAG